MLASEILPRSTELFPDTTAVVCGCRQLTYRELGERVARLAAGLQGLGVAPGDRVAVLHHNCHRVLETYFAAVHCGAVLVPLNYRLTARNLAFILDDTECGLLVVDRTLSDLGREAAAGACGRITLVDCSDGDEGQSQGGGYDYEQLIADAGSPALCARSGDENDPLNIYYTSGTTGHQKGVVLTHRNVMSHALATIDELELSEADVWAHVAPMFHLADAWAIWAMTWAGARHVMLGCFDPPAVLETMVDERVTVSNLVPTMLSDLVNCPEAAKTRLPDFRLVMSGGAPISPNLVARVVQTFDCEYVQTYGLTETSPYLTFSLLEDHHRALALEEQMRIRSLTGRPAQGVKVKVVGENGREVLDDGRTVGEILARGDRVTPGYWRLPEATAEAFSGGWFHTGDLATVDSEGYLNIVDRKKDVILTGGELVYSTEVEHVLAAHPAVLEVAVVGVPDDRFGEAVHAVVVARSATVVTAEELIDACRVELAHYKCPRTVSFFEELPRTGSGKISKRSIRENLRGG